MTLLMISVCGSAQATQSFGDLVNFSESGLYKDRDYLELSGEGTLFEYSYQHNVVFAPPANAITLAQVVLSHRNNSNNNGEVWFLEGANRTFIGTLADSTGNGWVDQVFVLPSSLYSEISGSSWSLQLVLNETTTGTDKLWVDKSELSGEYTPVPVPAAACLLSSGLVGLVGLRRKMRSTS